MGYLDDCSEFSYYTTEVSSCIHGHKVLIDRCEQPGFRSRDITVQCDICTEDDFLNKYLKR